MTIGPEAAHLFLGSPEWLWIPIGARLPHPEIIVKVASGAIWESWMPGTPSI